MTGNDIHLHFPAGAVEKVIITKMLPKLDSHQSLKQQCPLENLKGFNFAEASRIEFDTKDGPSAGVTIATTLVSLLTGRLVRTDLVS